MVSNPMQRKARNSFLLGMLLMLIITGLIIAILFMQIKGYSDKEKKEKESMVRIAVLNQDTSAGQIITEDMLETKEINKNLIPANAIGNAADLSNYYLTDKEGNEVKTKYEKNETITYITKQGKNYILKQEPETKNYYIEQNGEKKYIELNTIPTIAKVTMKKNSVLTDELIAKGNEIMTDDIRKQEYNVIVLPTQIQTGDYIDIRISLPSEQDYIVVSKKEVEIPQIDGVDSKDTIWVKLSEEEILAMNSAIYEAYKIEGSKIYATTYTEPGIQKASVPTFPMDRKVIGLLKDNPNVLEEAKIKLAGRYNESQRKEIDNEILNNTAGQEDKIKENIKTKVQESITKTKDERKQYLEGMASEE